MYEKAAEMYEKSKTYFRSASMYEKINQYEMAGEMYEISANWKKAVDMYEKDGRFSKSGEIYEWLGEFDKAGARYIHSASEPYNEEQELSQDRINAWINHFGMHKFQSHCSGHARGQDLINAVSEINAKTVFPVHTEHPDTYKKITENLILIDEGVKYEIGNKK